MSFLIGRTTIPLLLLIKSIPLLFIIDKIDTSLIYIIDRKHRLQQGKMRLNWKDIHLTNENIYNGSLNWHRGIPPPSREGEGDGDGEDEEQHIPRIPTDWDFSHLDNILETVLQKNPRNNVYLYGSVESAYDSSRPWADVADQAPVLVAITLPAGAGVPTRTVGRVNNQTTEDNLISFEDLNYTWVTAPSFGGRVHLLSCNADTAAIPDDEEEAQMHQHCSLFVATPREIKRDAQGRYKVDHVTFSFSDKDGEEEVESWDRSDGPLRDHLDQIVDDYFEDSDPEERASARERIEQVSKQCQCRDFIIQSICVSSPFLPGCLERGTKDSPKEGAETEFVLQ